MCTRRDVAQYKENALNSHPSASVFCPQAGATKPFDAMNGLAATTLLHLTAGMRFPGSLNVDLNEVTTNLVPYPRLHFLLSSLAPLGPTGDAPSTRTVADKTSGSTCVPSRTVDGLFADVFSREAQLLRADPRKGTYLAAALLFRGSVFLSDVRRNAGKLQPSLRFPLWCADPFKLGLCSVPPPGCPASLLALSNNTVVGATFSEMGARFRKLRSRNFYLHHYTQFMPVAEMDAAADNVTALAEEYGATEVRTSGEGALVERLRPLGVRG